MIRLALALAILASCDDPPVERLGEIRDAVCACKTSKCSDEALKAVDATKPPSTRRTQAIAREMMDCIAKIHRDERPVEE